MEHPEIFQPLEIRIGPPLTFAHLHKVLDSVQLPAADGSTLWVYMYSSKTDVLHYRSLMGQEFQVQLCDAKKVLGREVKLVECYDDSDHVDMETGRILEDGRKGFRILIVIAVLAIAGTTMNCCSSGGLGGKKPPGVQVQKDEAKK